MEALRVPPYPLTIKLDVPTSGDIYTILLEDLVEHFIESFDIASDENNQLTFVIPLTKLAYDRKYDLRVINGEGVPVLEDNLDIVRPYVNANKLATTASEIEEVKTYELVARSIIDSIITDGFYNQKIIYQTIGDNLDYLPLWKNAYRVLKVYENSQLVFDNESTENTRFFRVTLDNSGIEELFPYSTETINRVESSPPNYPVANGDLGYYGYEPVSFPRGYDYTLVLDVGYKTVPADIEAATIMLINDLRCGKLDQFKRYVEEYRTEQYNVKFNAALLMNGTGNIIVDRILSKYPNNITRLGIL